MKGFRTPTGGIRVDRVSRAPGRKNAMETIRLLIVDDDEQQLELVRRMLSSQGFEVRTSSSPIGFSNLVRDFDPGVILIDVNIPALSGDRLVSLVRKNTRSKARLVLYSSADQEELRRLATQVEADGWIPKGLTADELATRVRSICT